jgi:hypothetical protein
MQVDTVNSDWAETEGLLFPRQPASRTKVHEGWQAIENQNVQVNPPIDAARFSPPSGLASPAT